MLPEAVAAMLRQLHERTTAQIFACSGSIEKYPSDEIFAAFGIPETGPANALNRAVEMMIVVLAG